MKSYKGKNPELGWSLHMSGGWQSQLDCVRRWYRRANSANDQIDRYDFLSTFFENAFRLRDWLKDTGAVSDRDLQNFFNENEDMRLCQDIANMHKHYSINRPRQQIPPSEVREYRPDFGNLSSNSSLNIISNNVKHDAFKLAGRILQTWEDFIKSHVKPNLDEG